MADVDLVLDCEFQSSLSTEVAPCDVGFHGLFPAFHHQVVAVVSFNSERHAAAFEGEQCMNDTRVNPDHRAREPLRKFNQPSEDFVVPALGFREVRRGVDAIRRMNGITDALPLPDGRQFSNYRLGKRGWPETQWCGFQFDARKTLARREPCRLDGVHYRKQRPVAGEYLRFSQILSPLYGRGILTAAAP